MMKLEIYPKTERVKVMGSKIYVTEKIDGSNLCIFKKDNELYIATRGNIFKLSELDDVKALCYKGLYQWLLDHGKELEILMLNNAALCGEWLGMGQISYDQTEFTKRFYMFAKANIDENFHLYKIKYDHELFIYPFEQQVIPEYIGIVPDVCTLNILPNKEDLDKVYDEYVAKVGRNVEGFVLNYANNIEKYVRMKNGKLSEHFDRGN